MDNVPYIQTVDLSRTFGRIWALHRVNLRLEAGQLTALLGPNGAGKSTLLSILATLDQPSAGQVEYGPGWLHPRMGREGRGSIGWVSHDSLVYEELTARENLEFFGGLYRLDDAKERIESLLERVGLVEAADRSVRTFSRGMRQRLSLARGLLNDPAVWILDEPFTGLDASGRAVVLAILEQARKDGKLVLLATHALDLPSSAFEQVVVLNRGRLRYAGKPVSDTIGALYTRVVKS